MKNLALSQVVEAGQSSVDAVPRKSIIEAALVRPRQVETLLEYLQKSGSQVELHRALHTELEDAKHVQPPLFPPQSLAVRGLSVGTFCLTEAIVSSDTQ